MPSYLLRWTTSLPYGPGHNLRSANESRREGGRPASADGGGHLCSVIGIVEPSVRKRIPILILVLLLAGAGTAWFLGARHRERNRVLRAYGNVDIREVNLGFRVAGRVSEVLCDEGDAVKAGQVLARLDDEPYRREVDEASAEVDAARARLDLEEAGNRPQEIAAQRAVVNERKVTAANAERLYNRQENLFGKKVASVQERDDAQAAYDEAQARLHSAQEQLDLLEAGFRPEEIAQARAELAGAQAGLATAKLHVEDSTLKAPSAGVILTRAEEPGAVLQPGATVLTLSLTRPVWVRAYMSEPDLGRIHPGMKVEVFTDSRPGKPYSGQIGYISPRAEFTPKNVETPELRTSLVYRFRVVVNNPDEALRQGMPVTVKIVAP